MLYLFINNCSGIQCSTKQLISFSYFQSSLKPVVSRSWGHSGLVCASRGMMYHSYEFPQKLSEL